MASIELQQVERTYDTGAASVHALKGVSLELREGTATAIVGPSGSGKSTLLHICGALDRPSRGVVRVRGTDLSQADDRTLTLFRREHLGFIFQFFHLLPTLTAFENTVLPARLARANRKSADAKAR